MALIECPHCGGKISDTSERCIKCGGEFRICPECKRASKAQGAFCPECGFRFQNETEYENLKPAQTEKNWVSSEQSYKNSVGQAIVSKRTETVDKHNFIFDLWKANNEGEYVVYRGLKIAAAICGILCFGLLVSALIVALVWGNKNPIDLLLESEKTIKAVQTLIISGAVLLFVTLVFVYLNKVYVLSHIEDWLKMKKLNGYDLFAKDVAEYRKQGGSKTINAKLNVYRDAIYLQGNPNKKKNLFITLFFNEVFAAILCVIIIIVIGLNVFDDYVFSKMEMNTDLYFFIKNNLLGFIIILSVFTVLSLIIIVLGVKLRNFYIERDQEEFKRGIYLGSIYSKKSNNNLMK